MEVSDDNYNAAELDKMARVSSGWRWLEWGSCRSKKQGTKRDAETPSGGRCVYSLQAVESCILS